MDPRVTARNLTMVSSNENVLMAKSVNMTMQTPRKLPFKDATNNKGNELLKSALKAGGSASRVEKVKKQEPVLPPKQKECEEVDLGFDFSEFVPPSDGDCYCCNGNSKKVDEENWRKALAYADNFIANLLPDRLDKDFNEPLPPSPTLESIPLTDDRWVKPKQLAVEPFIDFDSSINGINNVNLDDTASSEPLEVPDLDSSLQIPDYCSEDESIIQDW